MDNGATCKMCGNYTSNKDGTPDGGCLKCGSEGPNLREIWAAADKKAKDWREAGEEKLLRQMLDAREGLKSLGWRDGQYAPKDGTRFLSIEAGSTGVFPCYWMTNKHMKEGGGFWSEAHGDLWPAKPTLWKPMPSNAKVSGAGTVSAGLPGYTAGDNTE